MYRTRVGYAGGTLPKPTYHQIGDHAEAIQVDYDPRHLSYGDFLDLFWAGRTPTRPPWKRQYMSAIFYADDVQKKQAEESLRRVTEKVGTEVFAEILPAASFELAEDYHQKYYLQRHKEVTADLRSAYGDFRGFVDSTAAARLNGYLGGSRKERLAEIDLERDYGLSESSRRILLKSLR